MTAQMKVKIMNSCTKERFLKDTENHTLEIVKDDGVFRHIVMSKNGSSTYMYELTTWPQYLCFSGDMGCFVFRRAKDMFTFFRGDFESDRAINPDYWHQKLEGVDRDGGSEKFSPEVFTDCVKRHFDSWIEDAEPDTEKKAAVWRRIQEDVLSVVYDNDVRAFDAANDFECEDFKFVDFWDSDFTEYTHRFIWCLYAIVYAIQQYDKAKEGAVAPVVSGE